MELTKRENEILTMLLTSMNLKRIAFILKISYYTVNFHCKNIYRKLGIQSRTELFVLFPHKIRQTCAV